MADFLLPDNTELCNFAAVDQMPLLRGFLGQRGRVTQAVAREIRQSAQKLAALRSLDMEEWFGGAIAIQDADESRRVDNIRTQVFGGTTRKPTQHLGESQSLFLILNRSEFSGSTWITDDGEAFRYAKRKGIVTLHTRGILEALVARGELSAQSAFEMCERMQDRDRPLLDPPSSPRDFG